MADSNSFDSNDSDQSRNVVSLPEPSTIPKCQEPTTSQCPPHIVPETAESSTAEICVICQSVPEAPAFASSCMHKFCFGCLQKWSDKQTVCPLCKRHFPTILHNVRALDDYDVYMCPGSQTATSQPPLAPLALALPAENFISQSFPEPWDFERIRMVYQLARFLNCMEDAFNAVADGHNSPISAAMMAEYILDQRRQLDTAVFEACRKIGIWIDRTDRIDATASHTGPVCRLVHSFLQTGRFSLPLPLDEIPFADAHMQISLHHYLEALNNVESDIQNQLSRDDCPHTPMTPSTSTPLDSSESHTDSFIDCVDNPSDLASSISANQTGLGTARNNRDDFGTSSDDSEIEVLAVLKPFHVRCPELYGTWKGFSDEELDEVAATDGAGIMDTDEEEVDVDGSSSAAASVFTGSGNSGHGKEVAVDGTGRLASWLRVGPKGHRFSASQRPSENATGYKEASPRGDQDNRDRQLDELLRRMSGGNAYTSQAPSEVDMDDMPLSQLRDKLMDEQSRRKNAG